MAGWARDHALDLLLRQGRTLRAPPHHRRPAPVAAKVVRVDAGQAPRRVHCVLKPRVQPLQLLNQGIGDAECALVGAARLLLQANELIANALRVALCRLTLARDTARHVVHVRVPCRRSLQTRALGFEGAREAGTAPAQQSGCHASSARPLPSSRWKPGKQGAWYALAGQIGAGIGAGAGRLVLAIAAVAEAVADAGGRKREGRQAQRPRVAVIAAFGAGASAWLVAAVATVAKVVVHALKRQLPLSRVAYESAAPHLTHQRWRKSAPVKSRALQCLARVQGGEEDGQRDQRPHSLLPERCGSHAPGCAHGDCDFSFEGGAQEIGSSCRGEARCSGYTQVALPG